MFRTRLASLTALLLVASASAQAHEVELRAETRLGGDSNVFRRATGPGALSEVQDGFFEVSPTITFRENVEELQYNFRYKPVFQTFLNTNPDTSGLSGWDHTQRGELKWLITDRDTIGITESFSQTRRVRQDVERVAIDEIVIDENDRQRIRRTSANAFYSRQWSNTLFSRFGLGFDDVNFDQVGNLDSQAYSGNASLDFVPRERWTIGANVLGRYRQTEGIDGFVKPENASILNVGLTLAHKLSPTIDLSLQAGPTLVWTKRRIEAVDFDTSFFVSAEAKKVWAKGSVAFNYSRSESASQGNGSSIIDSVRLTLVHSPFRRLRLVGTVDYSRRDQLVSNRNVGFGLGRALETESYSALGSVRYEVTPKVHVTGYARFQEVRPQGTIRDNPTTVISGFVSLEYIFDTWVF